jgi:putative FmdB family regulatory protein
MPIYEYDCKACGERFDRLVRRQDERIACPKCGSEQVTKRFSTFAPSSGGGKPPAPA